MLEKMEKLLTVVTDDELITMRSMVDRIMDDPEVVWKLAAAFAVLRAAYPQWDFLERSVGGGPCAYVLEATSLPYADFWPRGFWRHPSTRRP